MDGGIQPTYNLADRGAYGCGDSFGFGGGGGMFLFAIIALLAFGGGFGAFGNRGAFDGRAATVEDLANQSNFTRLEQTVMGNGAAIREGFTNMGNGICDLGYKLATDFGTLSKENATCCCEIKQELLENRYLAAQNASAVSATVVSQTQRILDQLAADKAAAQAARIQQLELNQALCGVVRYPTAVTYNAGYPFFYGNSCGCGCNSGFGSSNI